MVWTILTVHLSEVFGDALQGKRILLLALCPGVSGLDGSTGFLMRYGDSRVLGHGFFLRSKLDLLCMLDESVGALNVFVSL
jgi:hypothetical protein